MTAPDPLALDVAAMRALGYQVVDRLVARIGGGRPGLPRITREETEAALHGPAPEAPLAPEVVLDRLDAALARIARPRTGPPRPDAPRAGQGEARATQRGRRRQPVASRSPGRT